MEMQDIVRLLSRSRPDLAFVLVTLCLDDSGIRSWFVVRGLWSAYTVPEAELSAMDEALRRWDRRLVTFLTKAARGSARKPPRAPGTLLGQYANRALEWFDRPEKRDRLNELSLILLDDSRRSPQLREALGIEEPAPRRARPARRKASDWVNGPRRCHLRRWETLRTRLADLLQRVKKERKRCVTIWIPYRFVQFREWAGGTIRGEAISNNFLLSDRKLDRRTQSKLVSLGWNRPNRWQPNYWQTWDDTETPASVAVRTLHEAFGIESPRALTIEPQLLD
jgi:hypothetical protein